VRRHASAQALATDEDPERIAAIQDLRRRSAGMPAPAPDPEFAERNSRRSIAERLAAIFDCVLEGRTGD
jgi:hypothetical protein